ncbi:MAG TPA: phosphoribosylformylglycinamidine cyclo-ligase [Fimbriimonadaceae bacterium]|nr:phosphoribosylformylglycinamidine cyclo-ligase [Fimbriimonadaceae bacterium]HRJ97175.1 phosphoribosylformylglycinamidine cyclo-ligase [Fimbriimonadaceae bacterium]
MSDQPLTYRTAGVDIDEADRAIRAVAQPIQATFNENVVGNLGGFAGMFAANFPGLERPILVSSIDGIGTKTKVASMVGDFSSLGADIVNHCVNDILCVGARPLFFLDYFGCSKLNSSEFEAAVGGAAAACAAVGCVLIGGETAEMPGVYHDGEIDIVGTIVGVVDYDRRLPRGKMKPGDILVGLASDGLHTNGFSLGRRALFEVGGRSVRDLVPGTEDTLGEVLLRPHRCYFGAVFPLVESDVGILSLAHITGGGFYDNVTRVIPADTTAMIDRRSWVVPPIFKLIQECGSVSDQEMYRTFNMGIGMVAVVEKDSVSTIVQGLNDAGVPAAVIGELQKGSRDVQVI